MRGNINHSKKNSIKCDNVPDESRMVEEDFNESDFKEINDFIDETVDEEELLKQLEIDRKKRREEILKKYAESHSSGDISIEQPIQSIAPSEIFKDENETYVATNRVDTLEDDAHEVERLVAERQAIEMESAQEKTLAFDIFSSSPTEINDGTNFNKRPERGRQASRAALLEGENPHLQSDWDDGEGYYKTRVGEVLADRYRTTGEVGRGVFSTVLRCADIAAGTAMGTSSGQHPHVVLKLIRNNDVMRKAAEKEVSLLGMISSADEEGKKHCVRMLSTFEYRHHTVIVFEAMHMNLRETLKKFGKNVGINVSAVRLYGRQLLVALRHLASLQIVHADIKPDNIVVSEDLKQVKLCDFGSAFRESDPDNDPTPYLVSRFYRSPEIMLGMRYDRMLDLWSVAVCLYELFTGHVMFPGRSNNEMLKLQMEVKGRLPNKLIRSHLRAYETLQLEPFFDSNDLRFRYYEQDPVTGTVRVVCVCSLASSFVRESGPSPHGHFWTHSGSGTHAVVVQGE